MSLRRRLAYAGRHFTPTWRYGFNFKSTVAYRRERFSLSRLSDEAVRVLDELNRTGIAITSADRLPGVCESFAELAGAIETLEREWAERIESARAEANNPLIGRKTFILELLGRRPRLDPQSTFARFALQNEILSLANSYFEMFTQLRYYNVWHTLTTESPPRESQLWHYDREDHLILKLFVYCSDVDEGAGAITYAPGTHRKGRIRKIPKSFLENGVRRWSDEQMDAVVPEKQWIKGAGPKGAIVFADTRGYHKGGLARTSDRIMYTCMFTSPTAQVAELFDRPEQMQVLADRMQAFALTRG
ncbi:MAG TPA: hypothetical protein VJ810_17970 [Blastocatellia bacterium]|nr:hypothetical protein [Blastocatellia bacterium]